MPDETESLLDSVMYAVVERVGAHKRRVASELETLGLHLGQDLLLAHLWREDGLPQRDLAERLHVSAANVAQMLQGMQRRNLLQRSPDPADSRVRRVWLTEAGRGLREPVTRIWRDAEADWLAQLTPEQREAFLRLR